MILEQHKKTTGTEKVEERQVEWQIEVWARGSVWIYPQQKMNLDLWPILVAAHPPGWEQCDRWASVAVMSGDSLD